VPSVPGLWRVDFPEVALGRVSARHQRRIVDHKLVDVPIGQIACDQFHFGMFTFASSKGQKLLAKVDALLAREIRLFYVTTRAIKAVAGRTCGND
jgi:hypothetical protein